MNYLNRIIKDSERGFSVLESLVAVAILGIASVATVPLITASFHATGSSRQQASVMGEVESLVSDYKTMPFNQLLAKINSDLTQIDDGDIGSEVVTPHSGRSTIDVTFTAIKTQSLGIPEGVRVTIAVTQRRGILGDGTYSFETLITQVS